MALSAAQAGQKLDDFFAAVGNQIGGEIVGKALPLIGKVGDLAGGAAALDPFAELQAKVAQALAQAQGADVAQAIVDAIRGLNIAGVTATKTASGGVDVTLTDTREVTTGSTELDIGNSIGDFFSFKVNASARFVATLNATISFAADGTVSLADQTAPEVSVSVGTSLSVNELAADLGVAKVKVTDTDPAKPELNATFGLDLKVGTGGTFTIDPTLSGSASLELAFETTDVLEGLLPDMRGQFKAGFSIDNGAFGQAAISVDKLQVDLGSYLGIVGDTFGNLNTLFNSGPLGTIVDLATAPITGIDDIARSDLGSVFKLMDKLDKVGGLTGGGDQKITIGDLAVQANPSLLEPVETWYKAISLIALIRKIGAASDTGYIDFGGGSIVGGVAQSSVDPAQLVADLKAKLGTLGLPKEVTDFLSDIEIGGLPGIAAAGIVSPSKGFTFGLFENPEDVIKILLTKEPVDLVTFDVPALSLDQTYGGFFPVLGPLGFLLEGGIKLRIDVDVGYDTQGLIDGELLNGFFVSTPKAGTPITTNWDNPRGLDYLPVGALGTSLTGGAGVGFLGSSLTVNARFGFGLYAYFEAADTDGKYRPVADGFDCIFDPIGGRADLSLNVTIKIGFGPFSVKKNIPLAEAVLGDFDIFTCPPPSFVSTPQAPGLATLVGTELLLNVGDPSRADQRKLEDDHGNVSGVIANADNPDTPGREDLAESYVIGLARDRQSPEVDPSREPAPMLVLDKLDVFAFGFTQRVDAGAIIKANFGNGDDMLVIQRDVTIASDISGGAGNDSLSGGGGADTLRGGADDDYLAGNEGDDQLFGDAGDDQLAGGAGADLLDGGEGFDTVDYSAANRGTRQGVSVTITTGGAVTGFGGEATGDRLIGIESLIGTVNDDDFRAGFGVTQNVVFDGGAGNDILIGGKGEDLLLGGAGADLINGDDASRPDGKPAYDGTTYVTSWGAVDIDLNRVLQRGGDAQGDRLFNIEAVEGSLNGDSLLGNASANILFGNDGNDTLEGRGGRDIVGGGYGDDLIYGGADGDTLDGGEGRDTLSYEHVAGPVTVDLGATQQSIAGVILDVAGSAPDAIVMSAPPPPGGRGRSSFENLIGTGSADSLTGDVGENRIEGRGGADTINGGAGFDVLVGGDGADFLTGGTGIDWVEYDDSGAGVEVNISNGTVGEGGTAEGDRYDGIENLLGSRFQDRLFGNGLDNIIDPNISGSAVDEFVDGFLGRDTLRVDYSGIGEQTGQGVTGGFDDLRVGQGVLERLNASGTARNDSVAFTNIERLYVIGTSYQDTIRGGDDNDIIITNGGADTINSGIGVDVVLAGSGRDFVQYGTDAQGRLTDADGRTAFLLDGGSGIDTLTISLAATTENVALVGGIGNVVYEGRNASLQNGAGIRNFEILRDVRTGSGDDLVMQLGAHDNIFETGIGDDVITPGLGRDIVDGGFDRIGIARVGDVNGILLDEFFERTGDTLVLDYTTLTGSGVTSSVQAVWSGATRPGMPGVSYYGATPLTTNNGFYASVGDPNNTRVDFTEIERLVVRGSEQSDVLAGTYIAVPSDYVSSNPDVSQQRGNDILQGGGGNDLIFGHSGSDEIDGGDGDDILVGGLLPFSETQNDPYIHVDDSEIDILTGGTGGDLFVLGVAADPSGRYGAGMLYGDRGNNESAGPNQAYITDFRPEEGDRIQLYGASASYRVETFETGITGQATRIYFADGYGPSSDEPIATVENFAGLDLTADYIVYVDGATPPIELVPVPGGSDGQRGLATNRSLSTAASVTVDGFTVTQDDDIAALKSLLDGTTGGSGTTLTVSGSAEAVGTFNGDPFGLGRGIILSTGQVEDLPGRNGVESGGAPPIDVPLTFEEVITATGNRLYRAELTGLNIRSLTLQDSNSRVGGNTGAASGFDIDALVISRTKLTSINSSTDLNDPAFSRVDAFDYSNASMFYRPGEQRDPANGTIDYAPDLIGSSNGLVDNDFAELGTFTSAGNNSALILGDGGSLGLDLNGLLDTTQPIYLYVGEVGRTAIAERLNAVVTASPTTIVPKGDLSTDLGAEGTEGDATSLTYTFTPKAGDTAFSLQVVLFSEELPEFDGTQLSDLYSIKLNGREIGALSNGADLSLKSLVYSGSGDLVLNPVGTGPLANQIKADAYTKVLTISGAIDPGVLNTLTIEVRDGRDAFLDSGLLIKEGSFKTFMQPEVVIGGIGGSGIGEELPVGGVSGTITIAPPVGITVPVKVTVDPDDTITIGGSSGPGQPVTYTFNPGDPPRVVTVTSSASATEGQTGTIRYTVESDEPTIDGQPIAPDVITFVKPPNQKPEITPIPGEIRVQENTTLVTRVFATDKDVGQVLTYEISGGADKNLFEIDARTGDLSFKRAPDFERPADAGRDNVYDVEVRVIDNGNPALSDTTAIKARVFDAAENSTLVVQFQSERAGYHNSLGWYDTTTLKGGILFASVEADGRNAPVKPGVSTATFTVPTASVGRIGYFLVPNGADRCDDAWPTDVKVVQLSNGSWAVARVDASGNVLLDRHGRPVILEGVGANALFTETSKNAGGIDYASSQTGTAQTTATLKGDTADGPTGLIAWEDTAAIKGRNGVYGRPGDADYDDAVFRVTEIKGRTLIGDAAANILTGGESDDVLYGLANKDTLSGAGGNDKIEGGAGNDTLRGGNGNDTFAATAGDGDDVVAGDSGTDTYDLSASAAGAVVTATKSVGSATGTDTLSSIENVIGSQGNDTITLGSGCNLIDGQKGNDVIAGGLGDDILRGGAGNDLFKYTIGDGADQIDGGAGTDTLQILGNSGGDTLRVHFDGTALTGVAGGTVVGVEIVTAQLGTGTDTLSYAGSQSIVTVDLAAGKASGFTQIGGVENVVGGSGNDSLKGDGSVNVMAGGAGNDTYIVDANDIVVEGWGAGLDTVQTGSGAFTLAANVENLIFSGTGAFSGTGNNLANRITGGAGHDRLNGNEGNDVLIGGAGNDRMDGGSGNDTFVFRSGFGADTIIGFDADPRGGQDLLDVSGLGITSGNFAGRIAIVDLGSDMLVKIGTDSILLAGVSGVGTNTITQTDFLLA